MPHACTSARARLSGWRRISAREGNAKDGSHYCVDFARSSRSRASTDPTCAAGGICFIYLAADAVTWAARSTAAGGTDAPASLTVTQLKNIYLCKTRNWSKVVGKKGTIKRAPGLFHLRDQFFTQSDVPRAADFFADRSSIRWLPATSVKDDALRIK